MKKVTLCNHGQGPKRDLRYGKSWHIPNYQLFKLFKRVYHLLDFQKTWIFHEHQSVIVWRQVQNQTIWNINVLAQLAQKVGKYLSKQICSRQWSQSFKFKTIWKAFLYSMFQKFSEYNAPMFEAQVYLFHVLIHVRTKLFFKKYT